MMLEKDISFTFFVTQKRNGVSHAKFEKKTDSKELKMKTCFLKNLRFL